jgi:hypothetical protein
MKCYLLGIGRAVLICHNLDGVTYSTINKNWFYLLFLDKALFQRNIFPKAKYQNSTCLICSKISGKLSKNN